MRNVASTAPLWKGSGARLHHDHPSSRILVNEAKTPEIGESANTALLSKAYQNTTSPHPLSNPNKNCGVPSTTPAAFRQTRFPKKLFLILLQKEQLLHLHFKKPCHT